MPTIVHFIDVGQGNMVLVETANGRKFVFDCNITDDNEHRVLRYVSNQIGMGKRIDAFICSHRDADHIRGVKKLNARFPISEIWDSDYPGTTTNTPEYRDYMDLRRRVRNQIIKKKTREDFGRTRFRYLSAQDSRLPSNSNAQGIIIKVEHRNAYGTSSTMLTGDSDAQTWRDGVMADYNKSEVSSSILMAAHHGSIDFFKDPRDDIYYYCEHLKSIQPEMTLISVGPNSHGHPDKNAVNLYGKYSTGSDKGNKVFRTDQQRTMKLTLKDDGGWRLSPNQ